MSPQSKSTADQKGKGDVKENAKSNQGKRQYVTQREGNYECTYVVIGEHFKILIGRVPTNKDDEKDDVKTEDAKKKDVHELFKNNQTCQPLVAALPNNTSQKRIQAMEEYAVGSYYDLAKVDAQG